MAKCYASTPSASKAESSESTRSRLGDRPCGWVRRDKIDRDGSREIWAGLAAVLGEESEVAGDIRGEERRTGNEEN